MYDSFDNMYQATIGIDFLSKVGLVRLGSKTQLTNATDDVSRGSNGAITVVGYSRSGALSKLDSFIHPRFKRSGGGIRYFK